MLASWISRHLPLARLQISKTVSGAKSPTCTSESHPTNAIVVEAMMMIGRIISMIPTIDHDDHERLKVSETTAHFMAALGVFKGFLGGPEGPR